MLLTAYKDTMRIFLTMCQNVWRAPPTPHLWEPRAPKKTPVPAASELPSEFGLGTAEEDIGARLQLVAAEKIKVGRGEEVGVFRLRTTSTMRKTWIVN